MMLPALLFLVGPTAVGKTAVAIHLAREIGAEILSIDSRQVYRKLELGTAKPTHEERAAAPHHLLDLFEPAERASAGIFREHYQQALADIRARGRRAIAVGGAGLYVDACLGRLNSLPLASDTIRAEHERIVESEGRESLYARLREVDAASAARLSPRDVQRVSRALEVYEQTGVAMSRLQTRQQGPLDLANGPPMIILTRDREDLHARIETRARAMVAAGLPAEVKRLLDDGVPEDAAGMQAIGYCEFGRALRGEISVEEATEIFIRMTRHYAKRQLTWFRNRYKGTTTLEIVAGETGEETAQRVLTVLAEHGED